MHKYLIIQEYKNIYQVDPFIYSYVTKEERDAKFELFLKDNEKYNREDIIWKYYKAEITV